MEREPDYALVDCPFCDLSEDVQFVAGLASHNKNLRWIQCGCGARGPTEKTYIEAGMAWNGSYDKIRKDGE